MATTPLNRITRLEEVGKSQFESALAVISSSVSFNQGDLLCFNAATNVLVNAVNEPDASTFLGIARVTVVSGKIKSPYVTDVDASTAVVDVPGPMYGVVANMKLKTGDAFTPGALIYAYPTTDAQTISITGTKAIGIYQGSSVTATATSTGEALLGHRYPGDSLQF